MFALVARAALACALLIYPAHRTPAGQLAGAQPRPPPLAASVSTSWPSRLARRPQSRPSSICCWRPISQAFSSESPAASTLPRPPPAGVALRRAHVARVCRTAPQRALFSRALALCPRHNGRPQRPAGAPAARRLSVTALVPIALDAAHLHLPAAPGPAGQRAAIWLAPECQHVAAAAEFATHPSAGRPATAAAAAASALAAAHGLSAASAPARHPPVLSPPSARAARPAHEYGQHGAGAVQRDALPAAAQRRRPARPVRRAPQERDQAPHQDGLSDMSQEENKGERGPQWHAIGRRDVTREASKRASSLNREPP